jgi:two-component system, OmpR family, alkaline phosphatase synthesis response regulator PhoP
MRRACPPPGGDRQGVPAGRVMRASIRGKQSMEARKKILVVEDEEEILDIMRRYLERDNYAVIATMNGAEALQMLKKETPDLIILDLMLPGMDGLEIIRELRKDSSLPVLIVSARGEETDRVVGLELGADDYVTKPFSPRELMARVKALIRRSTSPSPAQKQIIESGPLTVDLRRRSVVINDTEVILTPLEFAILKVIINSPGRVFSREELLDTIWGQEFVGETRTVDVHIKNLRKKLESSSGGTSFIRAVRGVGYLWEPVG